MAKMEEELKKIFSKYAELYNHKTEQTGGKQHQGVPKSYEASLAKKQKQDNTEVVIQCLQQVSHFNSAIHIMDMTIAENGIQFELRNGSHITDRGSGSWFEAKNDL
jgi:hypothetical protein